MIEIRIGAALAILIIAGFAVPFATPSLATSTGEAWDFHVTYGFIGDANLTREPIVFSITGAIPYVMGCPSGWIVSTAQESAGGQTSFQVGELPIASTQEVLGSYTQGRLQFRETHGNTTEFADYECNGPVVITATAVGGQWSASANWWPQWGAYNNLAPNTVFVDSGPMNPHHIAVRATVFPAGLNTRVVNGYIPFTGTMLGWYYQARLYSPWMASYETPVFIAGTGPWELGGATWKGMAKEPIYVYEPPENPLQSASARVAVGMPSIYLNNWKPVGTWGTSIEVCDLAC